MAKKTTTNSHQCYVAVAVCNFDDVLIGVFEHTKRGRMQAMARARACAKNPSIRHVEHQANDTGFVFSFVYHGKGTKFTRIKKYEPPEAKKRATR